MPRQSEQLDPRASLIEDLLSRQDDVIRQLEALEVKLLATIEAIHPAKKEDDSADQISVEIQNASKAA